MATSTHCDITLNIYIYIYSRKPRNCRVGCFQYRAALDRNVQQLRCNSEEDTLIKRSVYGAHLDTNTRFKANNKGRAVCTELRIIG